MRTRRWQAVGLMLVGVCGVLGVSVVSAQRAEAPPRRLDPDVFALRLLLGVGDRQTQTWSGKVALDKGDFPAAAADSRGVVGVVYVEHAPRGPEVLESFREHPKNFANFVPEGGGDRIRLLRFADGRPGEPIDVTDGGLDVWRPAVAV